MILRGLVVFLACLNLGVGLWWLMHREPVVAPPPAIESGTGTLKLCPASVARNQSGAMLR